MLDLDVRPSLGDVVRRVRQQFAGREAKWVDRSDKYGTTVQRWTLIHTPLLPHQLMSLRSELDFCGYRVKGPGAMRYRFPSALTDL